MTAKERWDLKVVKEVMWFFFFVREKRCESYIEGG